MSNKVKCPICGIEKSKYGLHLHIAQDHEGKPSPRKGKKSKTGKSWNSGLTKETDERVRNGALKAKEKIAAILKENPKFCSRVHTDEFKNKQSNNAKKRGLGGVTQSRWIDYNGKKLGSSYELKVAQSLDEHNVLWTSGEKFNYIDPTGKSRTYTPDFYLVEYGIYLDPKNDFLIENVNPSLGFKDSEKISLVEQQNNVKILILNKYQLSWLEILKILSS